MRKALFRTMLLVVALVATIQSSLMAQNIKTYNGALCKPNTMICALDVEVFNEVSYEYYENDNYARVWHGRFTALYSRYYGDHSVVGCYEHGVQSGVWKESGVFYDKQGYLSYNFLNGKLHGDYHFESDDLVISAMFCDNHLSGSISVVGQNGQFFLSGQFDEDGFACGEWEVKYLDYNRIPFIREYVYDKGQVLSIVEIDDSTGERTTYSDQNGEDRRLLSYSGLDSWFSNKMPLYYLLSRRFVNPFKKASYNDAAVYHTVEAGETMGHIAFKYDGATQKSIAALNPDIDPTKLQIGQKICVRGNKPLITEENILEKEHKGTPDGWGDAKSESGTGGGDDKGDSKSENDKAGKYQGMCTGGVRIVALNDNSKPVKRIKVASRLRVDFELTANELAEPGEKTIYVCITNPEGYVLSPASKMIPFTFEGESRAASAVRKVSYENQSVPVSVFYDGEAFEKGTYTVDIYVDGRHCGSGSTYFE